MNLDKIQYFIIKNKYKFILLFIVCFILYQYSQKHKLNKNNIIFTNVENFKTSETHMYMAKLFTKTNKTNTFYHYKDFDTDNAVIRMNLDTLYSFAILDSTQNDIKLVLPDINDRYFSCCVLDEEHYEILFTTKGGSHVFPKTNKYNVCLIRILVKDNVNKDEIKHVNAIQKNIYIDAKNYSNKLILPKMDMDSYKYTKNLITKLAETAPAMSSIGMFGKKGHVNELKHLLGVNLGWGGLSEKQAFYDLVYPENNDGKQEYSLTVGDVPVNAFWSIIIYDKNGFILNNNRRSLNNFTAKKNKDGKYIINFSNNPQKINQLNITNGWNYTVRMYEPSDEILQMKWTFPKLIKE
jgi:hypothetical protein